MSDTQSTHGIYTTYENYAEPAAVRDADATILVECSSIQQADDRAMRIIRQRQLDEDANPWAGRAHLERYRP